MQSASVPGDIIDMERSATSLQSAVRNRRRFPLVDQLRGFAVVLMVVYHFSYNLTVFKYIAYSNMFEWPLYLVQRTCIITFLTCVGISLCLVHARGAIRWRNFWRRELEIGGAAMLISLGTYIAYPRNWINFGILHFVVVASLVALPLVNWPRVAGLLALAILIPYLFWSRTLPWFRLSHAAFDFVPLFPWIGYVLLGITAYHIGVHRWWHLPESSATRGLEFTGRHTLIIYLVHQPILLAAVWSYYELTHLVIG